MLEKSVIQKVLTAALSNGATFAEVFMENTLKTGITMTTGTVESALSGVDYGVGIRLFYGTKAVYAYTNIATEENLISVALKASKAFNSSNQNTIVLPFISTEIENLSIIKISPTQINKKDIVDKLFFAHNTATKFSNKITETICSYSDIIQDVIIANSEGIYVTDKRVRSRFSVEAIASSQSEKQTASERPGASMGYEFFDTLDMEKLALNSAESAVKMLEAKQCPSGKMPVIIDNGFGGVIFHEACGHSLEATAIAKGASVFCGKKGTQIANKKVTAIDDGTIPNAWGTLNVDDEGQKTQKNILIKDGILNSYLVDKLNGLKMGEPSTGSGRRESYRFAPTSRMNNTYIDNGNDKIEDIFASVEYGLYAKKMGGGSVQPTTGDFNFSVREAYIVRNGKICEPVRGATLIGKGSDILMNIDMVSNNLSQEQGICGSSSGSVPTNVGQPLLRVSEITIGGRG